MSLVRQLFVIGFLSLGGAFLTGMLHPDRLPLDESGLIAEGEITLQQAREIAVNGPVLWLDARTRDVWEDAHIPEAVLLNEDEWEALLPPVMDRLLLGARMPTVIVYCDSRACAASHDVAERLQEELPLVGEVYVLHGGWLAWEEATR